MDKVSQSDNDTVETKPIIDEYANYTKIQEPYSSDIEKEFADPSISMSEKFRRSVKIINRSLGIE